jgi:DNA polymerase III subunit beta
VKILIGRDALFNGIQNVGTVVPQKPTLPVLSNFLLIVKEGGLSISGTDMDMFITTIVPCTVEEEGSITVNARRFQSMIRELPSEDISIATDGDQVTVSFKKGRSSLLGMPSSDYPILRDSLEGKKVTVTGPDFSEMVEKSSFSVASDRTRLALTGVYWEVAAEYMEMVATDGHRLSLFRKTFNPPAGENNAPVEPASEEAAAIDVIVPPKVLNQAKSVAMETRESGSLFFDVFFGKGAILFDFGATKIFSKLIEGPYPDFRRVIPETSGKHVKVNTDELAGSVRRVSVLSNTITHQIRVGLSQGSMEISTINIDIGGESRETIPAAYDGEAMTVGYNAQFLTEILRAIDSEEIVLELDSPTSAGILRPGTPKENQDYFYLIMPLRLNE